MNVNGIGNHYLAAGMRQEGRKKMRQEGVMPNRR